MNPRFSAATNGVDPEAAEQSKLARVLDDYLAAVEAGEAVDPEALAVANPDIADRLRACLSVLRVASRVEARADADAVIETAVDTRLGDFRILRMIGRGAMGIVFEAEQVSLRRRVALKVLPFAAALDPHQLRRFQIEAQAAAQLHHTNIVPIFSVGCERGVHYYAMQFIEGQTLAALIHDLRRLAGLEESSAAEPTAGGVSLADEIVSGRLDPAPAPRSDGETPVEARPVGNPCPRPTGERVPQGRVRGRSSSKDSTRTPAYFRTVAHLGLQAAEALDHAHRLGIIHRDIKPANLLVDIRGNLWITDFGLARMQSDSGLTMTGDVIGTLRYMSPEQSAARRGIVDHRTDVYSLGAMLYELLTLHPAHDGRDRAELLHQIAFGEPKALRAWNPAIPRDLETIVLKATAKDVQNRYATARDLADDLERFLEHKPIRARRPSLMERTGKWSRRHQAVVTTAAVVLVLGTVGTSIGLVRALRAEHRATTAAERAQTAESLAKDRLVEVTKEKERATAAEAKAKEEAAIAEAVFDFLLDDLMAKAAPGKEPRDKPVTVEELLARAADRITGKFARQPAVEARIRQTIGNTYRALGKHSAARPHLERAWELARNNLGEEALYSLRVLSDLLLLDLDQGQVHDAEPLFDKVLKVRSRVLGEENPDQLATMANLVEAYKRLGRHTEAETLLLERLEIIRRFGKDESSPLGAMNDLAVFYLFRGQQTKAEPLLREVLKVLSPADGEESPEALTVMNNLSGVLMGKGEYLAAADLLEKTLKAIRRVRGEGHEETLWAMSNLGCAYWHLKKLDRSIPLFEEMVRRCSASWGPDRYQTIHGMTDLGVNYRDAGRLPEAVATLEKAWELDRKRPGSRPDPRSHLPMTLADAYDRAGQFARSEPLYREALEAERKHHGELSVEIAQALVKLGANRLNQRKYTDAESLLREALFMFRKRHEESSPQAAGVMAWLGLDLLKQRKYAEAEPLVRESLKIRERIAPDNWMTFNTRSLLGGSLLGQEKYAEAEPMLKSGYEGMRQREGTISPGGKVRLTEAIERLVQLYEATGKPEEAAACRARLGLADLPADVFARP